MALEKFIELPGWLKVTMVGGACLVTLSLLTVFLYGPKISEMRRIRSTIEQKDKEIRKAMEIERKFKHLTQEERELIQKIELKTQPLIPKGKDLPLFLYELAGLAKKFSISNISFKTDEKITRPSTPERKAVNPEEKERTDLTKIFGKVSMFRISLSFRSEYKELASFLDGLQNLSRYVEIEFLEIKKEPPLILVDLGLVAWFLSD